MADDLSWVRELTREQQDRYYAPCPHPTTEVRRKTIRGGAVQYRRQCLTCGEAFGQSVSRSDAERLGAIPDFDEAANDAWKAARRAEFKKIADDNRTQWFGKYDAYLSSPEWARRRALVMRRAGGICEGCGEQAATQVHHLTYDNVGAEFLWQLVAVCGDCHARAHEEK